MSYESGKVTADIGSATITAVPGFPIPGTGQTVKYAYKAGNGAVQDHFTATAGTTAYVYMIQYQSTANTDLNIYANDGTTIIAMLRVLANSQAVLSSTIPICTVAGGEKLKSFSPATGISQVWYVEQENT